MTRLSWLRSNEDNPENQPHVPTIQAANDTPTPAKATVLPAGVTLLHTLKGYTRTVNSVAWSPDGNKNAHILPEVEHFRQTATRREFSTDVLES